MKASDVIKQLQELVEINGDLEVRIYADHGQCFMKSSCVWTEYCEKDEYMADSLCVDEDGEIPDYVEKVIVISD